MLDAIADFIQHLANLAADKQQEQGLIRLLALIMFADGYDSSRERQYLDLVIASSRLEDEELQRIIDSTGEAVRAHQKADRDLTALADAAITAIGSRELLKKIYLLADRMANADRQIHPAEQHLLEHIVERTGG